MLLYDRSLHFTSAALRSGSRVIGQGYRQHFSGEWVKVQVRQAASKQSKLQMHRFYGTLLLELVRMECGTFGPRILRGIARHPDILCGACEY